MKRVKIRMSVIKEIDFAYDLTEDEISIQLTSQYGVGNYALLDITEHLDLERVCDLEFDGIDGRDAHDFCDAYISAGSYIISEKGEDKIKLRDLTDEELEWIQDEHPNWTYTKLEEFIY